MTDLPAVADPLAVAAGPFILIRSNTWNPIPSTIWCTAANFSDGDRSPIRSALGRWRSCNSLRARPLAGSSAARRGNRQRAADFPLFGVTDVPLSETAVSRGEGEYSPC